MSKLSKWILHNFSIYHYSKKDVSNQLAHHINDHAAHNNQHHIGDQQHNPIGGAEAAAVALDDLHTHGEIQQIIIYCIGNCFALLAMLWFLAFKKDDIRRDIFKLILFVLSAYVSMQLGRWLISLCFGGALWNLVGYLATDVVSLLFAVVLMLILRNVDGMIEDQKSYLFRLERQRKAEQESSGYTQDEF